MDALNRSNSSSATTTRLLELIVKMSDEERQRLLSELEERLSIKKRKYNRKPYFTVVDYNARDVSHTDFIQNISAGGVFIGTSRHFRVGEEVSMAFPLPVSQEHVMLFGEVAWVSEQGIGVKFKEVEVEKEAMIDSLVGMM